MAGAVYASCAQLYMSGSVAAHEVTPNPMMNGPYVAQAVLGNRHPGRVGDGAVEMEPPYDPDHPVAERNLVAL